MRLPFLRSKSAAQATPTRSRAAPALDDELAVLAARTLARRRLVGALVLLVIGVLGFPLLFETQPRPLPVDTPIELPRREAPAPEAARPAVAAKPAPRPVLPADAGIEQPSAAPASAASAPAVEPVKAAAVANAPIALPASTPAVSAAPASIPATTPRFVVQAGAFSEAAKLREARSKIEGLGLKTYIQVVETEAGKRTRIRIGPFATRAEADSAAARLKLNGLAAAVITL